MRSGRGMHWVQVCGSIQGANCSDVTARSTFPRPSDCPTPRSYLLVPDAASSPRLAPSTIAYADSLGAGFPRPNNGAGRATVSTAD